LGVAVNAKNDRFGWYPPSARGFGKRLLDGINRGAEKTGIFGLGDG
jgi:hypothetical protein